MEVANFCLSSLLQTLPRLAKIKQISYQLFFKIVQYKVSLFQQWLYLLVIGSAEHKVFYLRCKMVLNGLSRSFLDEEKKIMWVKRLDVFKQAYFVKVWNQITGQGFSCLFRLKLDLFHDLLTLLYHLLSPNF